jgi:hypothetical protein
MVLVCVTALVTLIEQVDAMLPAQCSPGFLDEVPPRIRKVCAALSTIYELGSAMENYINDRGKWLYFHYNFVFLYVF